MDDPAIDPDIVVPASKLVPWNTKHAGGHWAMCVVCSAEGFANNAPYGYPHDTTDVTDIEEGALFHESDCEVGKQLNTDGTWKRKKVAHPPLKRIIAWLSKQPNGASTTKIRKQFNDPDWRWPERLIATKEFIYHPTMTEKNTKGEFEKIIIHRKFTEDDFYEEPDLED